MRQRGLANEHWLGGCQYADGSSKYSGGLEQQCVKLTTAPFLLSTSASDSVALCHASATGPSRTCSESCCDELGDGNCARIVSMASPIRYIHPYGVSKTARWPVTSSSARPLSNSRSKPPCYLPTELRLREELLESIVPLLHSSIHTRELARVRLLPPQDCNSEKPSGEGSVQKARHPRGRKLVMLCGVSQNSREAAGCMHVRPARSSRDTHAMRG